MTAIGTEDAHALFLRVAAGEHIDLPVPTWNQAVHVRQKLNNVRKGLRTEAARAELARTLKDSTLKDGTVYTAAQCARLVTLRTAVDNCVFRLVPASCPTEMRGQPATIACEPVYDAGDVFSKVIREALGPAAAQGAQAPPAPDAGPTFEDAMHEAIGAAAARPGDG